MGRARGRRCDTEPKLNIKKVIATIIAIVVFVMFVISLKNLLTDSKKTQEVSTVTTYFTIFENNKWGVIDNKGKIVIDTTYDEMIVIPNKTKDLFICTYDVDYENGTYKTKVINKNKEQILKAFEIVEAIENYDNNSVWYESDILKYQKDGKYGLIDFSGKEILPAEYDKIYALPGIEKSIIIEKDGKMGLVSNSFNEIIINPEYAEIKSLTETYDNGYIVKDINSYYGVITADKKTALEFKYDEILNVTGNDMYVVREAGNLKLIKKTGETVLDKGFENITSINGENLIVKNNGKYGVIDLTGNSKIPCEYDNLSLAFKDMYIAKKDGKYGLIKIGNEQLIDFKYVSMNYRKAANFIEADTEDLKTDIIDSSLNTVLSGIIISEVNTEKGYIRIRQDSEYKYYNFNFEEKKAQDVLATHTLFLIKENGKYGYENKSGERIVDPIYDDATEQNEYGYVAVKKDGVWGSLKADGTIVLEPSVNLDNNLYINFIEKWHIYENTKMNIYTK